MSERNEHEKDQPAVSVFAYETVNQLMDLLLPILVCLGIINNPTSKNTL